MTSGSTSPCADAHAGNAMRQYEDSSARPAPPRQRRRLPGSTAPCRPSWAFQPCLCRSSRFGPVDRLCKAGEPDDGTRASVQHGRHQRVCPGPDAVLPSPAASLAMAQSAPRHRPSSEGLVPTCRPFRVASSRVGRAEAPTWRGSPRVGDGRGHMVCRRAILGRWCKGRPARLRADSGSAGPPRMARHARRVARAHSDEDFNAPGKKRCAR